MLVTITTVSQETSSFTNYFLYVDDPLWDGKQSSLVTASYQMYLALQLRLTMANVGMLNY